MCADPKNIEPEVWLKYYKAVKADQKGALPFRVAQIFDTMKNAAKNGERDRFVCAAGILTHYVFDSCMPLHISYMYNGDPYGEMKTVVKSGKEKKVPIADGIHEYFDRELIEKHVVERGWLEPDEVRTIRSRVRAEVDAAVAWAETCPYPDASELLDGVYAES
jgi:hypothetical protein